MIKKRGNMTSNKSYNDYSSRQIHEREMRKRIKHIIRIHRKKRGVTRQRNKNNKTKRGRWR